MVNTYGTTSTTDDRPYYYCLDAMYNVKFIVDRAGAIVERYAYDPYGKPFIRESIGRGDTRHYTLLYADTASDMTAEIANTIWDPRCDMDDDGDVDSTDQTLYTAKDAIWPQPSGDQPTVAQAFSDVGNPYMFQGVPHFAISSPIGNDAASYMLNHHRARFADPVIGRWVTRDPKHYVDGMNLYEMLASLPTGKSDPTGTSIGCAPNCPPPPPDPPPPEEPTCEIALACYPAFAGLVGASHCEWQIISSAGGAGSCFGRNIQIPPDNNDECRADCRLGRVGGEWRPWPLPMNDVPIEYPSSHAGTFPEWVCECLRSNCANTLNLCYNPLGGGPGGNTGNCNTKAASLASECGLNIDTPGPLAGGPPPGWRVELP